jgi:hypothetical protein
MSMTEVLILGNSILRPFDKFSHVKPWLDFRRCRSGWCSEIAIPMDKRAIHLVDKLNFQNYGQEAKQFIPFQEGF